MTAACVSGQQTALTVQTSKWPHHLLMGWYDRKCCIALEWLKVQSRPLNNAEVKVFQMQLLVVHHEWVSVCGLNLAEEMSCIIQSQGHGGCRLCFIMTFLIHKMNALMNVEDENNGHAHTLKTVINRWSSLSDRWGPSTWWSRTLNTLHCYLRNLQDTAVAFMAMSACMFVILWICTDVLMEAQQLLFWQWDPRVGHWRN